MLRREIHERSTELAEAGGVRGGATNVARVVHIRTPNALDQTEIFDRGIQGGCQSRLEVFATHCHCGLMTNKSMAKSIDFSLLENVDAEVAEILGRGEWGEENFRRMKLLALSAIKLADQDIDGLTNFVDELSDPDWSAADRPVVGEFKKLSLPIRKAIARLKMGWEPFVYDMIGVELKLNHITIPVVELRVCWVSRGIEVNANVEDGSLPAWDHREMGFASANLMSVKLLHGWQLNSSNAFEISRHMSMGGGVRVDGVTFYMPDGKIYKDGRTAKIWVIPVGKKLPVRNGNMFGSNTSVGTEQVHVSTSRKGLCLQGSYLYVILTCEDGYSRDYESYVLIETDGIEPDVDVIVRDMNGIKFVLGTSFDATRLIGLDGDEIVSIVSLHAPNKQQGTARHQTVVPGGNNYAEMFRLISAHAGSVGRRNLMVAMHYFIDSLDGFMEVNIQEALFAMSSLVQSKNHRKDKQIAFRVSRFFKEKGISLPRRMVRTIQNAADKLNMDGTLSSNSEPLDWEVVELESDVRTLLVATLALVVGYRGPISDRGHAERSPSWWPSGSTLHDRTYWSFSLPPRDITSGLNDDEFLILVSNPDHIFIVQWLLRQMNLSDRFRVFSACSKRDLSTVFNNLDDVRERIIVLSDVNVGDRDRAMPALAEQLNIGENDTSIVAAFPNVESWLLADDEMLKQWLSWHHYRFADAARLPSEYKDTRALVHNIFGSPKQWLDIPHIDLYRAADRSPSLREFIKIVTSRAGVEINVPLQSATRSLSRTAISNLMRDVLPADTIAWRTADGTSYTSGELALEIEQGTMTGKQYATDLIRMMIKSLERNARKPMK